MSQHGWKHRQPNQTQTLSEISDILVVHVQHKILRSGRYWGNVLPLLVDEKTDIFLDGNTKGGCDWYILFLLCGIGGASLFVATG